MLWEVGDVEMSQRYQDEGTEVRIDSTEETAAPGHI